MIGTAFSRVVELMLSIQVGVVFFVKELANQMLFSRKTLGFCAHLAFNISEFEICVRKISMMTNLKVCLCVERLVEGGGEVGGVLSTLTSLALEVSNFFYHDYLDGDDHEHGGH